MDSLDKMNLLTEILIGVDGRNGLPPEVEVEVDRARAVHFGRPMTDGELACALSHQRAYRRILHENLPGAIIFEDDAIVGEPFAHFMSEHGYEKADLITFGHRKTWVRRGSGIDVANGLIGRRLVATPIGAYGYSLNHSAARHILENSSPVTDVADWPCDISRLNALAMDPHLVGHPEIGPGQSHLEEWRRTKRDQRGRWKRFGQRAYWVTWFRKRLGRRIA